jgi:hypothetical protein
MKKIFLLSLSFILCFFASAQKMEKTFYYSPQYLFVNAIKLDFEIGRKDTAKSRFLISPIIQMGNTNIQGGASKIDGNTYYSNNGLDYPDDLLGVGLYLNQKLYLVNGLRESNKHHPYFSYGLSYRYSRIKYNYLPSDYQSTNGGDIYYTQPTKEDLLPGTDKFNIFGFNSFIGDKIHFGDYFVIDIYAGIGLKYTDKSTNALGARNYNRSIFDYGYTGIHPVIGARLGFRI